MNEERLKAYKKAYDLEEVDNAITLDVPINAEHAFYTDFSKVRGEFEDRLIYRTLNVKKGFTFNAQANPYNKQALFLAGMRGSGKTSEIAKYVHNLHKPDCFFCVVCNLDDQEKGLDLNDMEYMDILIFQIERLIKQLHEAEVKLDKGIVEKLKTWFQQRVEEVNQAIKKEKGFELDTKAGTPDFFGFLSITAKLKASIKDSKENAKKIRTVFRNNFTEFAKELNFFLAYVNKTLRAQNIAQEILFIVDGLEKTASMDIRKKIIIEENNRFKQIKAYTIFTLPIELMSQTQKLYAEGNQVISFPFVKLQERDGKEVNEAIEKFKEFVYKRIDESLFENEQVVKKAILYSGGSPRELLRILEFARLYSDEDLEKITLEGIEKGIKKMAAQTAQYLNAEDLETLKKLAANNAVGVQSIFGDDFQRLMENMIVMEYNDGTYKKVNPVVAESQLYKQNVG